MQINTYWICIHKKSFQCMTSFGFADFMEYRQRIGRGLAKFCDSGNRMLDKGRSWDAAWQEILYFCWYYRQIRYAAGLLFPLWK